MSLSSYAWCVHTLHPRKFREEACGDEEDLMRLHTSYDLATQPCWAALAALQGPGVQAVLSALRCSIKTACAVGVGVL
jgi:hypothetical protein